MSDLLGLQGTWLGVGGLAAVPSAPVPAPAPAAVHQGARRAYGLTRRLEPWKAPSEEDCPDWLRTAGFKAKAGARPECEPDPLKVRRDLPKTRQTVRKREVRLLRRRISELEALVASAKTEQAGRGEILARVAALEVRVRELERDLALERSRNRPVPAEAAFAGVPVRIRFLVPGIERLGPPPAGAEPGSMALRGPAPAGKPPGLPEAILSGLPWLGTASILAVATRFLVPDGRPGLKFAGYAASIAALGLGVARALRTLAEAAQPLPHEEGMEAKEARG